MKKRRYRKASFTSGQRKIALAYADLNEAGTFGLSISAAQLLRARPQWMYEMVWASGATLSSSDLRSLAYDGMTSWYAR